MKRGKAKPKPERLAAPAEGAAPGRFAARSRLRSLAPLLAILAIGMALRICYLIEIHDSPDLVYPLLDAAYHDYWAKGIAFGQWTLPRGVPDPRLASHSYFRPPGYPYFLAFLYSLTSGGHIGARVIQMLLGLLNVCLAYCLCKRMFGKRTAVLLAALMSTYWVFIFFEGELLAPTLLIALILSFFLLMQSWLTGKNRVAKGAPPSPATASGKKTMRKTDQGADLLRPFLAGITLGLMALTSPNCLVLVPLVLAWMLWLRPRGKSVRDKRGSTAVLQGPAVLLLGTILVVAPVTLRNYAASKEFVLISSNGGINLYIGNNQETDGVWPKVPELPELIGRSSWSSFDYPFIVRGLEQKTGRRMSHSSASRYFAGKAIRFIRDNPLTVAGYMLKKGVLFFSPNEVSNNREMSVDRENSLALRLAPLSFPIVFAFAVLGLASLAHRHLRESASENVYVEATPMVLLILLFVTFYVASYLPFFVSARYRAPILPLLMIFSAFALQQVTESFSKRQFRQTALYLGFALVVLLGLNLTGHLFPYEANRARWHYLKGWNSEQAGLVARAEKEYRQAVALDSEDFGFHYTLGNLLNRQAKHEEAAEQYRECLECFPGSPEALVGLGTVSEKLGQYEEALEHYGKTLELHPQNVYALQYLGRSLIYLQRYDEALPHLRKSASLYGDSPEVCYNLALALAKTANYEEARSWLKKLLAAKPGDRQAQQLLAEIERVSNIEK